MNTLSKYTGVIVPLLTPFTPDGQLDEAATLKILSKIMNAGTFPFALGTTGEAASLSLSMRRRVLAFVKQHTGDTVSYAGITCNNFEETVELAGYAAELGYDAIVPHLPSYFLLNDKLILAYYQNLLEATTLPIMLYNIPETTRMSIPLYVVEELSKHPRIIGLKDSESGEERLQRNLERWKDRSDFLFFVGNAAYGARGMLQGADGIVPSMGNLIPEHYQAVVEYGRAGKAKKAQHHQKICDEVSACCLKGRTIVESIPALKYMLHLGGYCEPDVKLPMYQPDESNQQAIYQGLAPLIEKYDLALELKPFTATV